LLLFLQENLEHFNADPESEIWQDYISYVDNMVVEGFFHCIYCSLNYFIENTEVRRVFRELMLSLYLFSLFLCSIGLFYFQNFYTI